MQGEKKSIVSVVLLLILTAFVILSPALGNVKAGILDLWQGKTEYTAQDNEQDIIKEVSLTYIFNNEIHSDYSAGTAYAKDAIKTYTYEDSDSAEVKSLDEVFTGYVGTHEACEFIEWNTNADGSGTSYTSGATVSLPSDTTLYAIWKSCKPTSSAIHEFDSELTGTGAVYGAGRVGSGIVVVLPDGVMVNTMVAGDGIWRISVPAMSIDSILGGEEVKVYQKEGKKLQSDPTVIIVQE